MQFSTTRGFTPIDGTRAEVQTKKRRLECLSMLSSRTQKLVRKTGRSRERNAEFYVINVTPAAEHPAEFHNGEELTIDQREEFRTLFYEDFPELLQPLDSPHVSRQWDHPIEIVGPI
jgi:hypothetical protein